jgi:fructose-specific component phosphotransferase system IIB-like protein
MRRREAVSERMEAAVKTAASLGQELQDAVQAELLDVLFDAAQEGKLSEIGPTGAARLALAFQENARRDREVAVKEQLVGVREREIVILEKKLADALDRQHAVREQAQRAKKAMEAAKASGGQLPEEVEKQVLAIYGLTEAN